MLYSIDGDINWLISYLVLRALLWGRVRCSKIKVRQGGTLWAGTISPHPTHRTPVPYPPNLAYPTHRTPGTAPPVPLAPHPPYPPYFTHRTHRTPRAVPLKTLSCTLACWAPRKPCFQCSWSLITYIIYVEKGHNCIRMAIIHSIAIVRTMVIRTIVMIYFKIGVFVWEILSSTWNILIRSPSDWMGSRLSFRR